MAKTLGDDERRVNVRAMHLRKRNLLSSSGRGLNAADMTPRDATNLLLACIEPTIYAKDIADAVERIRKSRPDYSIFSKKDVIPHAEFIENLPEDHTLGSALDAMFNELVIEYAVVSKRVMAPFFYISINLTETATSWHTRIHFHDGGEKRILSYKQDKPEFDGIDVLVDHERINKISRMLIAKHGHKHITVRVTYAALQDIAACLRGENLEAERVSHPRGAPQ